MCILCGLTSCIQGDQRRLIRRLTLTLFSVNRLTRDVSKGSVKIRSIAGAAGWIPPPNPAERFHLLSVNSEIRLDHTQEMSDTGRHGAMHGPGPRVGGVGGVEKQVQEMLTPVQKEMEQMMTENKPSLNTSRGNKWFPSLVVSIIKPQL